MTMPSMSVPWISAALGRRRITLLLWALCAVGVWVSRTVSCAITSLPSVAPSAARSSVRAKRRCVAGPVPLRLKVCSRKVMFSPLPWAKVTFNCAVATTP
ncbi:hypothetical protein D3C71_1601370 [compost metagenome]